MLPVAGQGKKSNVLSKVKHSNKYASLLFYFLKILTFPSQVYRCLLHLAALISTSVGPIHWCRIPHAWKRALLERSFFLLYLKPPKLTKRNLTKTMWETKKLHKPCSSLPCRSASADTSAGFQSNFWSQHGVYLKITSKQKRVMAGRMCFTDAGWRWKGNWAVDFGFWGCFVTLIKWRVRQTDFHCSQTCFKYWYREVSCIAKHEKLVFCFGEIACLISVRSQIEYRTYFASYISDFKLKPKNGKHYFCCKVKSPSSLNRRHFLQKTSTEGKERAFCVFGSLLCSPAQRWWLSVGTQQAAPSTSVAHSTHSPCHIYCEGGGIVEGEDNLNW